MGQITIDTTAPADARLVDAFTDRLQPVDGGGAPRNATPADVKAWLINQMKAVVHSYETRLANEAASAAITPIDPT